MQQVLLAFFMILLTVVVYFAMTKLYKRYSYSYLLPILTTIGPNHHHPFTT